MNNISHHLSGATISEYASGTLTESLEVVVASHLTLCVQCRLRAQAADSIGGYFLDTAEAATPKTSAKEMFSILQQDARNANEEANKVRGNRQHGGQFTIADKPGIPRPLARRLPDNLDALNWKILGKGIQQFDLSFTLGTRADYLEHETGSSNETAANAAAGSPTDSRATFSTKQKAARKKNGAFKLLKLQPGTKVIGHSHGHHELTLILQGSYYDSIGRFGVGDVADLGPDDNHRPIVDSEEPCIALIASDAPARYNGLMGRLIQPFVGI